MMKLLGGALLGLAFAGAAWAGDPSQPVAASQPLQAERALLAHAQAEYDTDEGSALTDLKAAAAGEAFGSLDPNERFSLLYMLTRAALQRKDGGVAFPTVKQAIGLEGDLKDLWLMRVQAAVYVRDYDDAAASLGVLAKRWPESLAGLSDAYLLSAPQKVSGESKEALLQALYDARWKPADQFRDMGEFWLPLVISSLRRGDVKQAAAVSHLIDNSGVLIEMRADKRFDPITEAQPEYFDIAKSIEAQLEQLRSLSAATPDQLEGVNRVAELLIGNGKLLEGMVLLDDAIAKSHLAPAGKPYFRDADEQLGWTFELKAEALELLGRNDEAVQARQMGADHVERGVPNVNQTLDLAIRLDHLGRPKEALAAVADFDPDHANAFGKMVWHSALACAFSQLADQPKLEAAMQYLTAHATDGPGSYESALLCANDIDGFAKELIADLEDPETRARALYNLQDFKQAETASAWAKTYSERRRRAIASRAVQAEIAKVGRIERYPIFDR